ncbi:MAG: sugar transferase [Clostridia bacterium]|nr:sugar transferase [Clostridia bacterium]
MYRIFLKRFLDIIFSIVIMPFFLIVLLIIGPIIFLEDKGKIFYNAARLGKNGKVFKMYKFRSMKENSKDIRNEDGSTYNGEDDPRVTKIGKILRKTSIDELPQIINVLKGDMSFIGPRPDLPEHMKMYKRKQKRKLEVRPGITGYNQAYYRNSVDWKTRIKNDIFYIDNISFWLDIKVLFKTLSTVFKHEGVYINIPEIEAKQTIKEENKEYARK